MNKVITDQIEVELPFRGFYNTLHEGCLDIATEALTEDMNEEDQYAFNDRIKWQEVFKEYALEYASNISDMLNIQIDFTEITSPKEYNFYTDRIFGMASKVDMLKIKNEVEEDPEWSNYIKNNFTSYDGFWSNYSDNCKDQEWSRNDIDPVQWSSVIEFYLKSKIGSEFEYQATPEDVYELILSNSSEKGGN